MFDRLAPVYDNAAIDTRYSCVPLSWYAESHGFADRNALFARHALDLIETATRQSLTEAGLGPADVDAIVVVSSSGIVTPSLDALLLNRLSLRGDVQRLPVFGLGCAGGVLGLARAAQMAISRPGARVLLAVVELCGLTFRRGDHSKSNIVATALFGDGAAAAVVSTEVTDPEQTFRILAWGEHTWPDTLDVMGWTIEDDGFGVLFSSDIPAIVRRELPAALDRFLAANDLQLNDIDGFALHPGGARVLEALESVMGLAPNGLAASRAVLRDYGNMSAATVLFVLRRYLSFAEPPKRILISSLGPGFSAGFGVLARS